MPSSTIYKAKIIILLIIGSLSGILFLFRSPLFLSTMKIPVSPIPLVFDSPNNFDYWANNYSLEVKTSTQEYSFPNLSNNFTEVYHRSYIINCSYFTIIGLALVFEDNPTSQQFLKEILCSHSFYIFKKVPKEENILKVHLKVNNLKNETVRDLEYICH